MNPAGSGNREERCYTSKITRRLNNKHRITSSSNCHYIHINKIINGLDLLTKIFVNAAVAPTHLFVTRVGPCLDLNNTVARITEFKISRRFYDFSLSGEFNISKDIDNGWSIKAIMDKCQDIRNLDSCDYFRSYTIVKNGCAPKEGEETDVYTMLFAYTYPRITCPIRAGVYKVKNYPFFMEDNYLTVSETKISTSVFGYTFRMEGYSGQNKMICADAYLPLIYIREHNWVRNVQLNKTKSGESSESSEEEYDKLMQA